MPRRCPLRCWFLLGVLAVGAVQLAHLGAAGWNPTAFLQVGADSPARGQIARDFPDLVCAATLGHDGKYSYLVAREPAFWRSSAETRAGLQDPGYRYARPLYPLLAGLGGTLPPGGTLAGLILVQVLAGGLATTALAAFARWHGLPTAFVLLNMANPGWYSSACLLTADLLAFSLALAAWHLAEKGRLRLGIAVFALALLAKEYHALTPLALAASFAGRRRWRAAGAMAVLPLLPIAAWKVALTAAVGVGAGQGNFSWPFAGVLATASEWSARTFPLGVLGFVVVLGALDAVTMRAIPARLRWACLAWGLLGACASRLVWADPADLLRAILPAWWLTAWAAFALAGYRKAG